MERTGIFLLNNDENRRDEIIGGNPKAIHGGIRSFKITLLQLQLLINEGFLNPDGAQNESPTVQGFLDFAVNHASEAVEILFIGYAVYLPREDYRVTIEGIEVKGDYSKSFLLAFINDLPNPDEFDAKDNYLRAWWD